MIKQTVVAATAILLVTTPVFAGAKHAAPDTRATDIHGLPGNNPGYGGSSANPNGGGVNGGNGIHNIAGGAPGQSGNHPTTGNDGTQPSEDLHGGLDNTVYGHEK